ncbi:MAG: DUF1653 domain-containing protein [Herbinix sp.]|nr:DUF1653 domain-containing protein [Herbinix sp.]
MDQKRIPKPGEIYNHFKDKPYQILTVAINTETHELMVVYQALYGDFKTYVRPLEMFISEVDRQKYPEANQKYRFELRTSQNELVNVTERRQNSEVKVVNKDARVSEDLETSVNGDKKELKYQKTEQTGREDDKIYKDSVNATTEILELNQVMNESVPEEAVNEILLKFLDADSYSKKLEVFTSNIKHLNDRLINDMAVALDCAVDEGPLDKRIQELIFCLQAMRRFEDRRLR